MWRWSKKHRFKSNYTLYSFSSFFLSIYSSQLFFFYFFFSFLFILAKALSPNSICHSIPNHSLNGNVKTARRGVSVSKSLRFNDKNKRDALNWFYISISSISTPNEISSSEHLTYKTQSIKTKRGKQMHANSNGVIENDCKVELAKKLKESK